MVFDASHNKQHIEICKDAKVIDVSKLKIIDTTKGARLLQGIEADVPLFMLVPREEVVGSGEQMDISSLLPALETLKSNNKVSLEHGNSRYVGHATYETMYTCSGVVPIHGGKGIYETGINDLPEATSNDFSLGLMVGILGSVEDQIEINGQCLPMSLES